jgi:glutathione S-transferase
MLTVWGRRSSFNLQKVMWLVGELELSHRHIPAGGDFGIKDTPEFLAMNPHGRVPVIDDDGTIVWESQTILRYLAARHGRGRFWTDDPGERSQAERWMDWSQASLQPDFLLGVFWGFYRTPEAQRNTLAVDTKIRACARHFQLLDRIWLIVRFCAATASPWPTSRRARRFTVISRSTSNGPRSRMSRLGTAGCKNARLTTSTSWFRSTNSTAASTISPPDVSLSKEPRSRQ